MIQLYISNLSKFCVVTLPCFSSMTFDSLVVRLFDPFKNITSVNDINGTALPLWQNMTPVVPILPPHIPQGTLTVFCNTWQRRRAAHTCVGINDHNEHTTRNYFSIGYFLQSRRPRAAVATDDALTWVGREQTNPRNQINDQGLARVYHLCILWLVTVSKHRHRPK